MKRVISVLLIVTLLVCFVACGSKGPSGRYEFVSAEASGMTFTAESLAAMGLEMDMYIQFNSDGTGELSAMGESDTFTWKDNVMTDSTGESITFTQDGDTISIEADDMKLVFEK